MARFLSSDRLARILASLAMMAMVNAAFAQSGTGSSGSGSGSGSTSSGSGGSGTSGSGSAGSASSGSGGSGSASVDSEASRGSKGERSSAPGRATGASSGAAELELRELLDSPGEASYLASARGRLLGIADASVVKGVPIGAFTSRIREAVAKGVPPDVLVQAIEADAARWMWAAELVRGKSWPPSKASVGFYLAVSSALRNGLEEERVGRLIAWASDSKTDAERIGAALSTASAVAMAFRTMETPSSAGVAGDAAIIMAASRLKVSRYADIPALARRAVEAGIGLEPFVAALRASIGRGGTIADFQKMLFP